jgi:hypothetical protein
LAPVEGAFGTALARSGRGRSEVSRAALMPDVVIATARSSLTPVHAQRRAAAGPETGPRLAETVTLQPDELVAFCLFQAVLAAI